MDILMLCGEIGKKGISKDRCDGRVRLAVGGPCCLVFALVKLQKSQVQPLVSQVKTQHSQCPRVDHIWEGQFVLSKLRYILREQSCLFTRRYRTVRQASPSFGLAQYAPYRPTTQEVKISGKLGIGERQIVS